MFIMENNYTTQLISRQIAERTTGKPQTAFISTVISEFEKSPQRLFMDVADKYYKNDNDILNARRTVIGRDPETNEAILMESKVLANNKLNHNFMKKLTRQKIGYMLGRRFMLTSVEPDDDKAEKMFDEVEIYFTKVFHKMMKNVGRDSIVKGIGWLMVYYDEKGKLKFMRVAPEEVIPLWKDSDHTVLDAVIRRFYVEEYTDGIKKIIKYIDFFNEDGVYHYKMDDHGVLTPIDDIPFSYNFNIVGTNEETGEEQAVGVNWSKIPFIPFKYDPDEQSLLTRIKALVDDYDRKTSNVANNIDDFPNSMLMIKNYDGSSKEDFVHNKNQYRTLFVQGDGDARALEQPINIGEIDKHIERLRQDIYEFGQGVNTADKDIRDTSGVALRFLYADLDMDCIDWGSEFEWSLMELIWFIQQDILSQGGEDYDEVKYNVIFNTDVIINESETIQNAFTSMGVISHKTVTANHPWTLDADKEMKDILDEKEDVLDLESEYGESANTGFEGQRSAIDVQQDGDNHKK